MTHFSERQRRFAAPPPPDAASKLPGILLTSDRRFLLGLRIGPTPQCPRPEPLLTVVAAFVRKQPDRFVLHMLPSSILTTVDLVLALEDPANAALPHPETDADLAFIEPQLEVLDAFAKGVIAIIRSFHCDLQPLSAADLEATLNDPSRTHLQLRGSEEQQH